MTREAQLARCDAEIAEIDARTDVAPAYLFVLGRVDWERERALIAAEQGK